MRALISAHSRSRAVRAGSSKDPDREPEAGATPSRARRCASKTSGSPAGGECGGSGSASMSSRTSTTTVPSRLASRNSRRGRGVALLVPERAGRPAGRDPHRVARASETTKTPAAVGRGRRRHRLDDERVEQRLPCRRRSAPARGRTSRPPAASGLAPPRRPSSRGRSTRGSRGDRAGTAPAARRASPARGSRSGARARHPPASAAARCPGRTWRPASIAGAGTSPPRAGSPGSPPP